MMDLEHRESLHIMDEQTRQLTETIGNLGYKKVCSTINVNRRDKK